MSTVREHLGLLWLSRRALMTSNPQYDKAWAEQAALFVGVHLDELIELAGGAEIEQWVREQAGEIPSDFPLADPILYCAHCHATTRRADGTCTDCGKSKFMTWAEIVNPAATPVTDQPKQDGQQ